MGETGLLAHSGQERGFVSLKNIKVKNKSIIYSKICKKAINTTKNLIKNKGRILVRASGTENKIRIMVESENKILIKKCINLVARSIKN